MILKDSSSQELLVGKSLFHDVQQYLLPNFAFLHKVGNSFLAILFKIEKQMFDAWGISIFVGFDFYNVDTLRLKSRKELLTLFFVSCLYFV